MSNGDARLALAKKPRAPDAAIPSPNAALSIVDTSTTTGE